MGSYLYLWGGFKCPFFVLGLSLIVLMILTFFSVKNDGARTEEDDEDGTIKLIADANKRSSFFYLLKNF